MLPAQREDAMADAKEMYLVTLRLRIRARRACEEAVVDKEEIVEAEERRRRGVCVFAIVNEEEEELRLSARGG